jgi:hypothetical protein
MDCVRRKQKTWSESGEGGKVDPSSFLLARALFISFFFVYYVWGVSETIVFQQVRLLGVREKRRPGTRKTASGYEKNGVSEPDAYEKNGVGYEKIGVGVREIRRPE